jgi:hypothetical protein
MQFRWVAVIALYTFLIGPVLDHPGMSSSAAKPTSPVEAKGRTLPTMHP